MKTGDRIMTPRFCTVTIDEVFNTYEDALAAGYREPTHYHSTEWGVVGKNSDLYHMTFAAYRKGN